jgi:thiol-disulfide isomerase/thioredoxin
MKILKIILMCCLCTTAVMAQAPATQPAVASAQLTMYPQFLAGDFFARNWMKTYPHRLTFSDTKPDSITVEPKYKGKPIYATLRLGDVPNLPSTVIAIDTGSNKIWVDLNQDGNLTNDPRLSWDMNFRDPKSKDLTGSFPVMANWKTGTSRYGVQLRMATGSMSAFWTTIGAPTGPITVNSKTYIVFLYDQLGGGLYDVKPGKKGLGSIVYIDEDGDGTWRPIGSSESAALGQPIELDGNWYSFDCTADGKTLSVYPAVAPPKIEVHDPIAVGEIAPQFTMYLPDGTPSKLSQRKGKTVLVDFWATWCGPCLAAMPKVQALHEKLKDNPGIEIIGMSVMDDQDAFDAWVKQNKSKYTFTIGFDRGKTDAGTDTSRAYGISAIPTTYLIGPDGKVVEVISGYTPENEAKIHKALASLGFNVD